MKIQNKSILTYKNEPVVLHSTYKFIVMITLFIFVALFVFRTFYSKADNANSVSIYEIDYEAETLTIQADVRDSMILISDKNQKTWEALTAKFDRNQRITMDISWIAKTTDYVLSIKGDYSDTPIKVTIPKQNTYFKVYFDVQTNTLNYSNIGLAQTVYYRKNVSTTWKSMNIYDEKDKQSFRDEMERYSLQGITLVFRLGQVKGNATSVGMRPSKEVTVSVAKRANAPTVTVNLDTLSVAVKTTMEYKLADSDVWNKISSNKLMLEEVAPKALYSTNNLNPVDVELDVRYKATDKKVASKTVTIKIPAQEQTENTDNILFEYTGSTQCKLTIKKASKDAVYEYTVVQPDKNIDYSAATWRAVQTSDSVTITSTQAPKGSKIYVRKKATKEKLATAPVVLQVSDYATVSSLLSTSTLKKVASSDEALTFAVKVPREDTTITSITFGEASVGYKTGEAKKIDGTDMYAITVTIHDTKAIEAISSKLDTELKGSIKLDNGDCIEDGVTLTIIPAATIISVAYTKYKDLEFTDELKLKINLNHKDKKDVTVTKITVDSQEVNFTAIRNSEDNVLEVTANTSFLNEYEEKLASSKIGTAIPFHVTLSNNEVIKSGCTLAVKIAATVSSSTSGFGLSYSAYLDSIAPTPTPLPSKEDDKPTTVEKPKEFNNPELTVTIEKTLYDEDDSIAISSVIWQGKNILRSFSCNKNVITLVLDIDKIANAVSIQSGKTYSEPVMIYLKTDTKENYVSINSGYRITLVE